MKPNGTRMRSGMKSLSERMQTVVEETRIILIAIKRTIHHVARKKTNQWDRNWCGTFVPTKKLATGTFKLQYKLLSMVCGTASSLQWQKTITHNYLRQCETRKPLQQACRFTKMKQKSIWIDQCVMFESSMTFSHARLVCMRALNNIIQASMVTAVSAIAMQHVRTTILHVLLQMTCN